MQPNIFECKNQCPHHVGDLYKRDCCAPECKGWTIVKNVKPIPDRRFDYDFWHDENDIDNGLCGNAESYQDACAQIVEIEINSH